MHKYNSSSQPISWFGLFFLLIIGSFISTVMESTIQNNRRIKSDEDNDNFANVNWDTQNSISNWLQYAEQIMEHVQNFEFHPILPGVAAADIIKLPKGNKLYEAVPEFIEGSDSQQNIDLLEVAEELHEQLHPFLDQTGTTPKVIVFNDKEVNSFYHKMSLLNYLKQWQIMHSDSDVKITCIQQTWYQSQASLYTDRFNELRQLKKDLSEKKPEQIKKYLSNYIAWFDSKKLDDVQLDTVLTLIYSQFFDFNFYLTNTYNQQLAEKQQNFPIVYFKDVLPNLVIKYVVTDISDNDTAAQLSQLRRDISRILKKSTANDIILVFVRNAELEYIYNLLEAKNIAKLFLQQRTTNSNPMVILFQNIDNYCIVPVSQCGDIVPNNKENNDITHCAINVVKNSESFPECNEQLKKQIQHFSERSRFFKNEVIVHLSETKKQKLPRNLDELFLPKQVIQTFREPVEQDQNLQVITNVYSYNSSNSSHYSIFNVTINRQKEEENRRLSEMVFQMLG